MLLLKFFVLQVTKADFTEYDYIFGMDDDNISELNSLAPRGSSSQIVLLGNCDPQGELIIRDPYYVSTSIAQISPGPPGQAQLKYTPVIRHCFNLPIT